MPVTVIGSLNYNNFIFQFMSDGKVDMRWAAGASNTINADSLWSSFKASSVFTTSIYYSTYSSESKIQRVYGGSGSDIITKSTGGDITGSSGNDIVNSYAIGVSASQQHIWGASGADTINLNFTNIATNLGATSFSHGHHARGDGNGSANQSSDIFNFTGLSSVITGKTVVGRIEDLDISRDIVQINGAAINLNALPSNAKIVVHNGDHNDPGAAPIQWLVIRSSAGGYLVYALEGARVDMQNNGMTSNEPDQEPHFISSVAAAAIIAQSIAQPNVKYVDPQNVVPTGMTSQGGIIINDWDETNTDASTVIMGSANGDLIAGGLNNDTVQGGAGNDQIWGGSGHDLLNGEDGNDTMMGGTGNDTMNGGSGNDTFIYSAGNAMIYGNAGVDTLSFMGTSAAIVSIVGQTNVWGINISGIENLSGGAGADNLTGHSGANILTGNNGNDTLSSLEGEDSLLGGNGNDMLLGGIGFDTLLGGAGNDTLEGGNNLDLITGGTGNDSFQFLNASEGGDTIIDYSVNSTGNDDRFLIDASGFGGGLAVGGLAVSQFVLRTTDSNSAVDATDRFIFNSVTNTLWFDADGTGLSGPVLIAKLQSNVMDLTAADIWMF